MFVGEYRQIFGLAFPAMLPAQIQAESGWRDGLTSSANAQGLCQFLPSVGASLERQNPGLSDLARFSPAWCAKSHALLMRDLRRMFGKDRSPCTAHLFALAGYVGSPSTLQREIALCEATDGCNPNRWFLNVAETQGRRDDHFRESRDYVLKIFGLEPVYAATGSWGSSICR